MTARARRVVSLMDLPLRALYPMAQLARATGMGRTRLRAALDRAGVRLFRSGRTSWVPLSEIQGKVPALWECIRAAEMLRQLLEER
jgi:hypothetical protein